MQSTFSSSTPVPATTPPLPAHNKLAARLAVLALVFSAACLMFFTQLGTYPLFNPDEALYAEPAREMLVTGEYVTTLLNYVVRYTKPPLCIWAMAGAYKIFGVNEFAARFLGAACGAILVAITYLFLEKYASRRTGVIAAAALITAPLFIGTAREAITDMPLSLFIGGSLLSFFHGYKQGEGRWRWLSYVLIGLAVMTKGPVGLILPAVILAAYHFLRGDIPRAWSYYRPFAGLAVVALIAIPWFAIEIYITKGAYYYEFLVKENFQRFTSVVDHKGAWWYHIAAVAGGFLPWTVFVPQALIASCRLPAKRDRMHYGLYANVTERQSVALFAACWFLIVLAFFSVSVSKLLPYTVPAFSALAVVVAIYLDDALSGQNARAIWLPLSVLALVFGGGLAAVPFAVTRLREAPLQLISVIQGGLTALLVSCLLAALVAARRKVTAALTVFACAVFATVLIFGGRAVAAISQQWEGAVPEFSRYVSTSPWPVIVWHMRKPSIPFYADRPVEIPLGKEEFERRLSAVNGAYVIGKTADLPYLLAQPRTRLLARKGLFVLVCRQPNSR